MFPKNKKKDDSPQMTTRKLMELKVGADIDFRLSNNKFILCKIIKQTNDNVCYLKPLIDINDDDIKIEELQFKKSDNLWIENDGLKIAKPGSISNNKNDFRFKALKIKPSMTAYFKTMVTQDDDNDSTEFEIAKVEKEDLYSKQIKIAVHRSRRSVPRKWVDINNIDEFYLIRDFVNEHFI